VKPKQYTLDEVREIAKDLPSDTFLKALQSGLNNVSDDVEYRAKYEVVKMMSNEVLSEILKGVKHSRKLVKAGDAELLDPMIATEEYDEKKSKELIDKLSSEIKRELKEEEKDALALIYFETYTLIYALLDGEDKTITLEFIRKLYLSRWIDCLFPSTEDMAKAFYMG